MRPICVGQCRCGQILSVMDDSEGRPMPLIGCGLLVGTTNCEQQGRAVDLNAFMVKYRSLARAEKSDDESGKDHTA